MNPPSAVALPPPTGGGAGGPAIADEVVEQVRAELARRGGDVSPALVADALRGFGRPVGDTTVLAVHDRLRRETEGAGPLEELLRLPGVTDVLVNGHDAVLVDRGRGLEPTAVRFPDDGAVRRLAQRLAAAAGRRLDDASPYADVRMRDGTRFHAVLAPVARPGTVISLRVPRRQAFTMAELVAAGGLPEDGAVLLERLVRSRAAFMVSGGTGSGKTTLLNALLSLADPRERLVLVEDTSELRPDHPHVVGLEARPANVEGVGEIDLRTLVRQALRMRPDRIVVGEVRGAEVADLLAALNTGHEGGCGTVHANAARPTAGAADRPGPRRGVAVARGPGPAGGCARGRRALHPGAVGTATGHRDRGPARRCRRPGGPARGHLRCLRRLTEHEGAGRLAELLAR